MKVIDNLRKIASTKQADRADLVESFNIQNYGSGELTETDMWILRNAASSVSYLERKLKEADELSLDVEAPPEETDELTLDAPAADAAPTEELSLDDAPAEDTGAGELTLDDTPAEDTAPTEELTLDDASAEDAESELSLDDAGDAELSLDDTDDALSLDDESDDTPTKIETSREGVGILPLIAQIQDLLAGGKPSEVELAALKAIRKLF